MVSIIILAYSLSPTLKITLDSALNQTLKDVEVIVIGKKELQSYLPIIEKYQKKGKNIKYHIVDDDKTIIYGYLFGISCAKGKYISFVTSNDYFYNSYLEVLIKKMQTDPLIKLATTSFHKFKKDRHYGGIKYHGKVLENDEKFRHSNFMGFRLYNLVVEKQFLIDTLNTEDITNYNGLTLSVLLVTSTPKYYQHGEVLYFRGNVEGSIIDVEVQEEAIFKARELNLPKRLYADLLLDEIFIKMLYHLKRNNQNLEGYIQVVDHVVEQIKDIKWHIITTRRSVFYKRACFAVLAKQFDKAYRIIAKLDI